MTPVMTAAQAARRWLRGQRLDGCGPAAAAGIPDLLRDVGGLQAQVGEAAALGVRARSSGLVAADLDRLRGQERSVVRTWAWRGTLHLIAAEDLRWMLALVAPVALPRTARRHAQLGLEQRTLETGSHVITDALAADGPLTRAELVARLQTAGIDASGQRAPHLLWWTAMHGTICCGPDRGRDATYVLIEDWLPPSRPVDRVAALSLLAGRFLAAYGAAAPQDLAAWSGLPLGDARKAWSQLGNDMAGRLTEVRVGKAPAWLLAGQLADPTDPPADQEQPVVTLLPAFDTYLLGHRSRELIVPAQHARTVHPGGGIINPVLLVDGRAAGTWRSRRRGRRALEISVRLFADATSVQRAGVEREVTDIARFLDAPAHDLILESPEA
jgi:uncharacterized protein YjiS (DUF1127 family)